MKLSELQASQLANDFLYLSRDKRHEQTSWNSSFQGDHPETCKKYFSRYNMSLWTRDLFPHVVTYISYVEERSAPSRLHSETEVLWVSVACHPNGLHRGIMSSLDSSNISDGYQSQALSRTVFSAYLPVSLSSYLCVHFAVLFMATRKHVFFI